jgi:hypothetical protein
MEIIVNSISKLKGVHHACIYHNGIQLASTFPDDAKSLETAQEITDQIFSALLAIERSYNEIYFSIGDQFLAAFLMHDNHIALLLTEKKINFPLINMGVKSASTKIRLKLEAEKAEKLAAISAANNSSVAFSPETNPDFEVLMEQLSTKLIFYLGPAAPLVLEDCLKQWKQKYTQTVDNLPHLIEIAQEELDTDDEKNEFADAANKIINESLNNT